jgi:hypothetical protein
MSDGIHPEIGYMKIDTLGEVIWSKKMVIPNSLESCSFDLLTELNGDFYILGLTKNSITQKLHGLLAKLNQNGDPLWSKEYEPEIGTGQYSASTINFDQDSNLIFQFSLYNSTMNYKIDRSGSLIWGKNIQADTTEGGKNPGFDIIDIEGKTLFSSKFENTTSFGLLDEVGDPIYQRSYQLGDYSQIHSLLKISSTQALCFGFAELANSIPPILISLNINNGDINWIKQIPTFDWDYSDNCQLFKLNDSLILSTLLNDDNVYYYLDTLNFSVNPIKLAFQNTLYNSSLSFVKNENSLIKHSSFTENFTNKVKSGIWNELECGLVSEPIIQMETFDQIIDTLLSITYSEFPEEEYITTSSEQIQIQSFDYCEKLNIPTLDKLTLSIWPNPAEEKINIQTDKKITQISIIDLNGKTLQVNQSKQIDISALPAGIYILKCNFDNRTIRRKFIKK